MEKYQTKEINSTHSNSTVVIRRAGDTKIPGELGYVNIIADSAHVVTFYDGESSAGDQIFIKPASATPGHYKFNRPVVKGLCAVVANGFAGELVVGFN